jgi:hypothetical protein
MNRRDFLKILGLGTVAVVVSPDDSVSGKNNIVSPSQININDNPSWADYSGASKITYIPMAFNGNISGSIAIWK